MRVHRMAWIVVLALFAAPVQAAKFKGGHVACVSEALHDEIIDAMVRKDERGFKYLLQNGCIITRAGVPISILKRSWTVYKVRAYVGDRGIVLWTARENVIE